MNRNPIATHARCLSGNGAFARAAAAAMSCQATLVNRAGGVHPSPGQGDASS